MAAAVTTRSQAASRIRLGPIACQKAMSNSRPGARPRSNRVMITRSRITLYYPMSFLPDAARRRFRRRPSRSRIAVFLGPRLPCHFAVTENSDIWKSGELGSSSDPWQARKVAVERVFQLSCDMLHVDPMLPYKFRLP